MSLGLNGYLFDESGHHGDPVIFDTTDAFTKFVTDNVMKYHELRVVDQDDMTVFQVINRVLIFPIPEHGSKSNIWDDELQMFATIPDA